MIILHIATLSDNLYNGVNVVVPQHVMAQGKFAKTALINTTNVEVKGAIRQLSYEKPFLLDSLPKPYNKPDLVVFHEVYRADYLRISIELKHQGIPYVIVPHGELTTLAQKKKHLKKTVANILLFNRFVDGAAGIQCLSEQELKNTQFGKKKFIGFNGIGLPDRDKESFSEKKTHFIYIGRLDHFHKGLDLMIEAVCMSADYLRSNHVRLEIYGPDYKGRYARVDDMIHKYKVEDIVYLHHEIKGEEKRIKLLSADIFIQTSRFEGMPLGILEALAYGLPCLVTEGTNLGQDISSYDAGWTAQTTAESIAEKMRQAVQERSLWQTKGKNGRALIQNKYLWDIIANDTVNNYERLINGGE